MDQGISLLNVSSDHGHYAAMYLFCTPLRHQMTVALGDVKEALANNKCFDARHVVFNRVICATAALARVRNSGPEARLGSELAGRKDTIEIHLASMSTMSHTSRKHHHHHFLTFLAAPRRACTQYW